MYQHGWLKVAGQGRVKGGLFGHLSDILFSVYHPAASGCSHFPSMFHFHYPKLCVEITSTSVAFLDQSQDHVETLRHGSGMHRTRYPLVAKRPFSSQQSLGRGYE